MIIANIMLQLPSGAEVELGATWFHGIQGNPLYDIAVWEGLVRDLRGDPGDRFPLISHGYVYAEVVCNEMHALLPSGFSPRNDATPCRS